MEGGLDFEGHLLKSSGRPFFLFFALTCRRRVGMERYAYAEGADEVDRLHTGPLPAGGDSGPDTNDWTDG